MPGESEDRKRHSRRHRDRSRSQSSSFSDDGRERRRRKEREREMGERQHHRNRSRSRSFSPSDERRKRKEMKEREKGERRHRHGRSRSRSSSLSDHERERKRRKGRGKEREERPYHHRSRSRSHSHSRDRSRSRSRSRERRKEEKRMKERERELEREKEREKEREERKKQKELLKALETPEEKRARRLAKIEAKKRKEKEKMGWDQEYMGYTNADNPFGDQHLLETFVWHKKRQQQVTETQLSRKDVEKREKIRQEEMKRELEKVKKRRIEREKEKEARDEEMFMMQRMKEAELFKEWESQEDDFHLQQAQLRSKIRIESGRAKPIDLLAKYVNMSDEDMDIEVQEPYHLLRGLNVVDLEDLLEDIKVYCELEQDTHLDYWKDMTIVCGDELHKLRRLEEGGRGGEGSAERRGGINAAVATDVNAIFKGKTHGQLLAMEAEINKKIHRGDTGTDVGFYESLLQQLKAHMARARLKDRHQAMLRKKLFRLKQTQADQFGITGTPLFPSASTTVKQDGLEGEGKEGEREEEEEMELGREDEGQVGEREEEEEREVGREEEEREMGREEEGVEGEEEGVEGEADSKPEVEEEKARVTEKPGPSGHPEEPDTLIAEEDLLRQAYADYESGGYSPRLLKQSDVEEGQQIFSIEEDASKRASEKRTVLAGGKVQVVDEYGKIEMVRTVGADGLAEEEYNFNSEVSLGSQDPIWKEKYRPRKPRFINRVHTGFEWNKYNQTHYDTDNPPPKIVQGYKFNVFYPDLIDKRKTPEYTLTPCADNKDFAILRFHAGPPYEDIAFKIVNREWEYSWKHGFKSQFNNNILQLWFRFKRNRYRR